MIVRVSYSYRSIGMVVIFLSEALSLRVDIPQSP